MKKIGWALVFGLVGLIFHCILPFLMELLLPGNGVQGHGEDEAGRQLITYFIGGGIAFLLLWAHIGNVFAESRKRAVRMVLGVLLGTFFVTVLPRLLPYDRPSLSGWHYDLAFIVVWFGVSSVLAVWLGRRRAKTA